MNRPKILLADDSITVRKVVELTFADEGIDVVSVPDGDQAMKKFVEMEPDLVIADVHMPGMSGYQICEMIKQDESTANIPVILLAGSFEEFDPGEASRVGSNYYFTKPFRSIREVVDKVREYLAVGTFDTAAAETSDIDELYTQSFSEPTDDRGEDDLGELAMIEREETVSEDTDLGDAGMDDELIETVKIDESGEDQLSADTENISEFETTLEGALPFYQEPTDLTVPEAEDNAPQNEAAVDSEVNEPGPSEQAAGNVYKFSIEEDDDLSEVADQVVDTTQFTSSQSVNESEVESSFSPELVEIIAARVIEKLSDQAVRDAAREAVPRIAEKLIREALSDEGKKT